MRISIKKPRTEETTLHAIKTIDERTNPKDKESACENLPNNVENNARIASARIGEKSIAPMSNLPENKFR